MRGTPRVTYLWRNPEVRKKKIAGAVSRNADTVHSPRDAYGWVNT